MTPGNPWLVCGIASTGLADDERRLLGELRPGGVILFARNVADRAQLAALVTELSTLPWRPYLAIDLEGGRVNRLEPLLGRLPAQAQAAAAGRRAREVLHTLERQELRVLEETGPAPTAQQLSLFPLQGERLVERLRRIDLERLTPIEALNLLAELRRESEG